MGKLLAQVVKVGICFAMAACTVDGVQIDNTDTDAPEDTSAPPAAKQPAATSPGPNDVADSAPPGEVQGLYFGACLSALAFGRLDRVLLFYTETKFTPNLGGSRAGKLTLKLTPLKVGAPTVSRDETIGDTYTIANAATNSLGVYAGKVGTVQIPGVANPISGRDIIIDQAALPGRFQSSGKFCSQLIGHVVQPTDVFLEGDANTCVYFPVKEGDKPPVLSDSDFSGRCGL